MNMVRLVFIFCFVILVFPVHAQKKHLIEFGWDYPDVKTLHDSLPVWQHAPFDGICFSLQRNIQEAFDTVVQGVDYFEYERMTRLKWGKYQNNFIILRGYGQLGGYWFDDAMWNRFDTNMRALSKSMAGKMIKGILFDPEYYNENMFYDPWTYSRLKYPAKGFTAVCQQVRKRGMQFVKALQSQKPDLHFISIWFASLIAEDRKIDPLENTRHALLIPFLEGMMLGKNKEVKMIEGNEFAYWNTRPSQFYQSSQHLKTELRELFVTKAAKKAITDIEIAQPVFYDGLLARHPTFDKGIGYFNRWKWMEENTKHALASSDRYVWVYTERADWWRKEVSDTLYRIMDWYHRRISDKTYRLADSVFIQGKSIHTSNMETGKGYYYSHDLKKPMETTETAFHFSWQKKSKQLSIRFENGLPDSLSIYCSTRLLKKVIQPKNNIKLPLPDFSGGQLILLAAYRNNTEAVGIKSY